MKSLLPFLSALVWGLPALIAAEGIDPLSKDFTRYEDYYVQSYKREDGSTLQIRMIVGPNGCASFGFEPDSLDLGKYDDDNFMIYKRPGVEQVGLTIARKGWAGKPRPAAGKPPAVNVPSDYGFEKVDGRYQKIYVGSDGTDYTLKLEIDQYGWAKLDIEPDHGPNERKIPFSYDKYHLTIGLNNDKIPYSFWAETAPVDDDNVENTPKEFGFTQQGFANEYHKTVKSSSGNTYDVAMFVNQYGNARFVILKQGRVVPTMLSRTHASAKDDSDVEFPLWNWCVPWSLWGDVN